MWIITKSKLKECKLEKQTNDFIKMMWIDEINSAIIVYEFVKRDECR